jgi:hypothetical protein
MDNSQNNLTEFLSTEYQQLVDRISTVWDSAKSKAIQTVNAQLIEANWLTGQQIVEFEQQGNVRAQYGVQLLVNLSKDLTMKRGRGFSRSNLTYMRKLYLTFPKCETLSHKLTWSHYFENQLFAARYQLYLPKREELQAQYNSLLNEE